MEKLAAGSGAQGTLYTAAPAIASNILPPPRARPSDSAPARLMRGQPMSAKERHGLFQHGPREDDDASAGHYNLRRGDTTEERCICHSSANMRREPTRHVSRSTETRPAGQTAHADLFGPTDVQGRGGVRYGFVAAVETGYFPDGATVAKAGPDFIWTRALRDKDEARDAVRELE